MIRIRSRADPDQDPQSGRKIVRYTVAVLLVLVFFRQGLLAASAVANVRVVDGVLIVEPMGANTTGEDTEPDCESNGGSSNTYRESKPIRIVYSNQSATTPELPDSSEYNASDCTGYRAFAMPEHHTGLPYLADVFATRDKQHIVFVGNNRGICSQEFKFSDNWMDGQKRFMCVFPGNTMVISEFVAPTGKFFKNNYMFKCAIPQEFQHLVIPGAENTKLHIDLHALHDPESPEVGMDNIRTFPSQKVTDTPKMEQIPVCHAGYANLNKTYDLVAYTRTKSYYNTQVNRQGKSFVRSSVHRIQEWIDWHADQGFDHFIIYDNDETPHGELEDLTRPYVEAGLVTYRWWPMKDCRVLSGRNEGWIRRYGQAAGGLAAMHRLTEKGAKMMAHMDVDEFFVMYDTNTTVLEYASKMLLGANLGLDTIGFRPHVLDHCSNFEVKTEADSPMATKQCFSKSHASDYKLIMKMETMQHFQVHYALATKSWQSPRQYKVPWDRKADGLGFLAHYRGEMVPGVRNTQWHDRAHYFDKFLEERKKKVNAVSELPVKED